MTRNFRPALGRFAAIRRIVIVAVVCLSATVLTASTSASASPTTKIINGSVVSDASFASTWDFMAALVYADTADELDAELCGGSLIATRLILTAAHCVTYYDGSLLFDYTPENYDVITGRRILNDDSTGQRLDIQSIFVHPDFNPATLENDVAVIRLPTASTGDPISVVGVGENTAYWNDGLGKAVDGGGPMIAGFGNQYAFDGVIAPDELSADSIPLASDAVCGAAAAPGFGTDFKATSMICGGILDTDGLDGTTNGHDTCQGDSGGPLIYKDGINPIRLIGTTSWGFGCASEYYGVYTRLGAPAIHDWILSIDNTTGGPTGLIDPSTIQVTSLTVTSASLSWVAPGFGPAPTGYTVYSVANGVLQEVASTAGTSTTVSNLLPSEWYHFVIRSSDVDDNESPGIGSEIEVKTLADIAPPSKPTNLSLRRRTRTSLTPRWDISTDNVAVSNYVVQYYARGRWRTAGYPTSNVFRIRWLKPNTVYRVRVAAEDGSGNISAWSATKKFRTRS